MASQTITLPTFYTGTQNSSPFNTSFPNISVTPFTATAGFIIVIIASTSPSLPSHSSHFLSSCSYPKYPLDGKRAQTDFPLPHRCDIPPRINSPPLLLRAPPTIRDTPEPGRRAPDLRQRAARIRYAFLDREYAGIVLRTASIYKPECG